MPDATTRTAKLTRMFGDLIRTVEADRGIVTTAELGAVALWSPPGHMMGIGAFVRSGFALVRSTLALPREDRRRMLRVLRQVDGRRKALMPEAHWYLQAIGVDPDRQGRGLGTALVRDGLRRADEAGTRTYLETETEGNVAFYERLGFEVIEQLTADAIDLPLWLMARPPGRIDIDKR